MKKSDSAQFFHYQGASYMVLFRVFKQIFEQTKHLAFTDIGCGKGRVIFVAEYCGYNHLTGIELDETLLQVAKANEKLYPFKRKESDIHFIHANALHVDYKNVPALYFLFNPFDEAVLEKVLEKICSSTTSETWFVYMNPLYKRAFNKKNIDMVTELKTGRYTEAIVYRLNPVSAQS
ncbi:MAG: class I SAM-dependent methyltransferase [Bacteroidota bacterium]